jgi:ParB family transcriptional regulator, chromosome partitioning protein
MRRAYPHLVKLSAVDQTALLVAQTRFDEVTEEHQTAERRPDEADGPFNELKTKPTDRNETAGL